MVAPLLQAQVDINAPVSTVWALISDFRRMPQWSPQCRWMRPFGPVRPGTRTLNLNRRNLLFWPTTSTVIEVIPGPEAGVPGQHQQHDLELRTPADRRRHPGDREPARRERRQAGVRHGGERVPGRDGELRAGTRRRHERLAGQDQSRGREQLARLRGWLARLADASLAPTPARSAPRVSSLGFRLRLGSGSRSARDSRLGVSRAPRVPR